MRLSLRAKNSSNGREEMQLENKEGKVYIEKLFYTWEDFEGDVMALVENIKKAGFVPKVIYGVPRGGLPLAVKLAYYFDACVTLRPEEADLIVDDVADSGKTLIEVTAAAKGSGKEVKCATLFFKECSRFNPDFYIRTSDKWICFPWEVYDED